jgi:antitoxin component of MazEF toxin-antitoxin module
MLVKIRRWGNSLAIRIPKRVAEKLGITEGDIVRVDVLEKVEDQGGVDLASLPTFRDEDRRASLHHDEYLYGRQDENR